MKRIAFVYTEGLGTFITPIADEIDKSDDWVVDKQSINFKAGNRVVVNQLTRIIDWADIIWHEWANEVAILGTNSTTFPEIVRKKVIVRLHSYEALLDLPKQIEWKNVHKLVFVSDHIREIANTYELIPGDVESITIPNGIDMSKFKRSNKIPDPYHIAWVGYINYKKNPPMMLQIMQKLVLCDHRYKLYIAGAFQDRRYEVYLQHMVKQMNLKDNIIFDGWIKDMDKWYQDKGILLSTSIHEGHSYCIMEAMIRGITPVIHNFFGADKQYPGGLLFNTVDEAVYLIKDNFTQYPIVSGGDWLRNWVIDNNWTFFDQMESIKELINGI